jgi:hypothetical protein
MKIKILLIIAISAIITLSFTFKSQKEIIKTAKSSSIIQGTEPIGGFVFDDK